jgi:hypothetical protein
LTGGLATTLPIAMTLSAFSGIAWYICIELNVKIFMVFKRYRGLYFWSLLLCSWGTFFIPLLSLMKFFQVWKMDLVSVSFILVCWCLMVTGQAFVLYSRLHLIVHNSRKIKWILYMIIFDAIVLHIPVSVLALLVSHGYWMLWITRG